jgi:hypothetical protein
MRQGLAKARVTEVPARRHRRGRSPRSSSHHALAPRSFRGIAVLAQHIAIRESSITERMSNPTSASAFLHKTYPVRHRTAKHTVVIPGDTIPLGDVDLLWSLPPATRSRCRPRKGRQTHIAPHAGACWTRCRRTGIDRLRRPMHETVSPRHTGRELAPPSFHWAIESIPPRHPDKHFLIS